MDIRLFFAFLLVARVAPVIGSDECQQRPWMKEGENGETFSCAIFDEVLCGLNDIIQDAMSIHQQEEPQNGCFISIIPQVS